MFRNLGSGNFQKDPSLLLPPVEDGAKGSRQPGTGFGIALCAEDLNNDGWEICSWFCHHRPKLISLCTLTSFYIFSILFSIHFLRCWQGENVSQSRASLVGDHNLYSPDLIVWFRGDIVRRN